MIEKLLVAMKKRFHSVALFWENDEVKLVVRKKDGTDAVFTMPDAWIADLLEIAGEVTDVDG